MQLNPSSSPLITWTMRTILVSSNKDRYLSISISTAANRHIPKVHHNSHLKTIYRYLHNHNCSTNLHNLINIFNHINLIILTNPTYPTIPTTLTPTIPTTPTILTNILNITNSTNHTIPNLPNPIPLNPPNSTPNSSMTNPQMVNKWTITNLCKLSSFPIT